MTNTAIRQKLHNYLEVADDAKLEALYTIMQVEIEEAATIYDSAFKNELDRRYEAFKNGTVEMVSAEDGKKQILDMLNAE